MNPCEHCGEEVLASQRSSSFINQWVHHECGFRMIIGSVAHVEGRCSCYMPGSCETDPPGLTPRQAAQAALDAWHKRHPA